jgi:hypothetical protein
VKKDLQRYLDGELTLEALSPEERAAARHWDTLLGDAAHADERAPDWLAARIMSDVRAQRATPSWRRALSWFLEPRLQLRPITAAGLCAAAAVLYALPLRREPSTVVRTVATAPVAQPGDPHVFVQFVFAAKGASSVSIAGDFNAWDASRVSLRDPDGDGVWTGLVSLTPGEHEYMFVVDGEKWVTDPRAERYADDGFGMRNALIAIADPRENAS